MFLPIRSETKKEFWTWNLNVMPPEDTKIQATCRGIGKNVYVFVSNDVWMVSVFQKDIERIINAFDFSTPETSIDKNKGIYEIITKVFGSPPDVDNDHRIYFLISQLGAYHGHHFDGFFRFIDEIEGKYSNHAEILYLDCDNASDDYHLGIIAHEFQHLIHWQYDRDETAWLNESLSEVAMILCGYYTDKKQVAKYLNNTDSPLISKGHQAINYGACLLWGTYIYERLGIEFLGNLVCEKENGIKGFQKALINTNIEDDFSRIFGEWLVTNYINTDLAKDKNYKYKSISLPTTPAIKHFFSLPIRDTGKVVGYAVNYLKFSIERTKSKKLRITFKSDSLNDFLIKIIRIDNDDLSNSQIEDVILSEPIKIFDVNDVGVNYREIILVVSVLKVTKEPIPYSFSASLIP
ncbi:MAG: Neutral metalloprotease precursor [Candidatus Scalindua rubra]|uniref:Neutral metalloprotease n=1 Tax=Candidatus Scalindua rubra TaxID=1872076 RepID=A0A1E3X685_9BACT|nr:MAG: Neutral metalloprotease precursor [Candidatus Scalindua rubra]